MTIDAQKPCVLLRNHTRREPISHVPISPDRLHAHRIRNVLCVPTVGLLDPTASNCYSLPRAMTLRAAASDLGDASRGTGRAGEIANAIPVAGARF